MSSRYRLAASFGEHVPLPALAEKLARSARPIKKGPRHGVWLPTVAGCLAGFCLTTLLVSSSRGGRASDKEEKEW